jgi:hypothetical protein
MAVPCAFDLWLAYCAQEGAEVDLRVKPADIECELQKGTTGYLAHMASRHEKEVANAKSLMRGWWNRASTEVTRIAKALLLVISCLYVVFILCASAGSLRYREAVCALSTIVRLACSV